MHAAKLLLLPNLLGELSDWKPYLPAALPEVVASLNGLIAESDKEARRYLRKFLSHEQMAAMPLASLNEHTDPKTLDALLDPIAKGERWGLISDAGLPCIADPGAELVQRAHARQIAVETFAGPSSILMALQLSGFCGQRFAFHGYLPREEIDLEKKLIDLERRSQADRSSQIWIEAPYRSAKLLAMALKVLKPATRLCVAVQLTCPDQRVAVHKISDWNKTSFPLGKEPAVFVLA